MHVLEFFFFKLRCYHLRYKYNSYIHIKNVYDKFNYIDIIIKSIFLILKGGRIKSHYTWTILAVFHHMVWTGDAIDKNLLEFQPHEFSRLKTKGILEYTKEKKWKKWKKFDYYELMICWVKPLPQWTINGK